MYHCCTLGKKIPKEQKLHECSDKGMLTFSIKLGFTITNTKPYNNKSTIECNITTTVPLVNQYISVILYFTQKMPQRKPGKFLHKDILTFFTNLIAVKSRANLEYNHNGKQ